MILQTVAMVLAMSLGPVGDVGKPVYKSDFSKGAGGWSKRSFGTTVKGGVGYLGTMASEIVSLRLDRLPEHKWVRVRLNLIIIGSWDGNSSKWGQDRWWMAVHNGPRLIETSFSIAVNHPPFNQSWPNMNGMGSHSGRTGSIANDALGFDKDQTYLIDVVFPHTGKELVLKFAGDNLEPNGVETWALSKVRVEVYAQAPGAAAKPEDLAVLLGKLQAGGLGSQEAMWRLIGAGAKGSETLASVFQPTGEARQVEKGLAALIVRLNDPHFRKRQQASRELLLKAVEWEAQIRKALASQLPAESRARLIEVLRLSGRLGDGKRATDGRPRALWALGVIGNETARATLGKVARTSDSPDLRELAARLLQRIKEPPAKEPQPKVFSQP